MGRRSFKRGKKRKRENDELKLAQLTHFYPLLDGWHSNGDRLIFSTPSSALCYQLSRYYKDGLCYSPHKPLWLDCVGGISLSGSHLKECSIVSRSKGVQKESKVEKGYFRRVQAYSLSSTVERVETTTIVRATQELFTLCMSTLKEFPCYQCSSKSIYRTTCINVPGQIEYVADRNGMKLTRDKETGMVSIGVNSRAHYRNKSNCGGDVIGEIASKVKNACIPSDTFIVVSVCCGIPITEIESQCLCLCLDRDKKALSTGVIVKKNSPKKSRTILAEYNYGEGMKSLLQSISDSTGKQIKILFQHPSPSAEDVVDLRRACTDIMECIATGTVSTICFVYDSAPGKTCWEKDGLLALCKQETYLDQSYFYVSDEKLISKKGDTNVIHPLFGPTSRFGWARMKNSDEFTFSISRL